MFSPIFFWSVCSRCALDLMFVFNFIIFAVIVSNHSNSVGLDVPSGAFVLNFVSGLWASVLLTFSLW